MLENLLEDGSARKKHVDDEDLQTDGRAKEKLSAGLCLIKTEIYGLQAQAPYIPDPSQDSVYHDDGEGRGGCWLSVEPSLRLSSKSSNPSTSRFLSKSTSCASDLSCAAVETIPSQQKQDA